VLVHEYAGRVTLYHLDLYRIDVGLEVHDLGIDEMLTTGACVVEWADKAPEVFPDDHLAIEIAQGAGEDDRELIFAANGARYEPLVAAL
jgi:tRNA threonylcarbamoyladenosine biosynthesis protein TsaE